MSSHAVALCFSQTHFFHHSLCDRGQEPLHVHNSVRPKHIPMPPLNPWTIILEPFALAFPRWISSAWSEMHQVCVGKLFALSSQSSNLWAICCRLGNVLHTLHGHICTRALTSLLFLAPARHWRLLWWYQAVFQNRSDCLSWVTLPACF